MDGIGSRTGAPRVDPFVGRDHELAVLRTAFDRAAAGEPRIVWIDGPSGIGKSRLIRGFLDRCGPHHLLRASGEEFEASLDFGILDQLVARLGDGARTTSDPLVAGAELLAAIGAIDEPVMLVVDDIQWVDPDSAKALLFLLRRVQAEPLLTVLVGRSELTPSPGEGWRRLLDDPGRADHLRLAGLSAEALAELAVASGANPLGPEAARRLHDHTGGHPLHAATLLDELGAERIRDAPDVLPVPRSLAADVVAAVDGLGPNAQSVLAAASVLGRSFAPELAAMVAGIDRPADALDLAIEAGLLDRAGGGSLEFHHQLTHAAVYGSLDPAARRDLHRAAAEVTSGDAALRHRVLAAPGPDAQLVTDLERAARGASDSGRHSHAADLLDLARGVAPDPTTREDLLLASVECVHAAGDAARAGELRASVETCDDSPRRDYVLGLLAFSDGRLTESEQRLARTMDGPATGGAPGRRTRAAATLALARVQLGDWDGAVTAADEAQTAGNGDSGVTWDRAIAQFAAVFSLAEMGRLAEAYDRVLAATPQPGERSPGVLDVLAGRGMARMLDDDVPGAVVDLEEVARRARAGEPIRLHELALANLADVQHRVGHWDDAMHTAELAAAMATDTARSPALVRAYTVASTIAASRGAIEQAEAHRAAAVAALGAGESQLSRILVAMTGAVIATSQGDAAGAVESLGSAFDGNLDPGLAAAGPTFWRSLVVEVLLGAGHVAEATEALSHLEAFQPGPKVALHHYDLARMRGRVALVQGSAHDAIAAFEEGCSLSDDRLCGSPAWARLLAEYGQALANLGRRREAIESLRAARAVFSRLGARPEVDRCDAALADCGLPRGPAESSDPLVLTDAESRVARLAADGLTNREIADRLYVSTKTIEYHLRNVYSKLGVGSRRELPTALTR